jgi:hypothetical protein
VPSGSQRLSKFRRLCSIALETPIRSIWSGTAARVKTLEASTHLDYTRDDVPSQISDVSCDDVSKPAVTGKPEVGLLYEGFKILSIQFTSQTARSTQCGNLRSLVEPHGGGVTRFQISAFPKDLEQELESKGDSYNC